MGVSLLSTSQLTCFFITRGFVEKKTYNIQKVQKAFCIFVCILALNSGRGWVQSQASICGICGGQRSTKTGSVIACHYQSTNAPYSFIPHPHHII